VRDWQKNARGLVFVLLALSIRVYNMPWAVSGDAARLRLVVFSDLPSAISIGKESFNSEWIIQRNSTESE
jgi:hypothetical protein